MATNNSCAMLMLAVVVTVSLNTTVSGQEVGRSGNRYSRVTVRQDQATNQTIVVHDHRNETPSGTTSRSGTNIHDHRKTAMSFTEASKMFSRYKQLTIGNYRTYGNADEEAAFILPSDRDDVSRNRRTYYVKGMVNKTYLELERGSGSGFLVQSGSLASQFNLAWNDKNDFYKTRWIFQRKSSSTYAIRYGEPLAIQLKFWVGGGRGNDHSTYIKYGRQVGAIIKHAKKKSFEWALLGGKPGELVRTGDAVVLYNLKHQQPLIYFRGKGNDVGWPDSADIKDSPQQVAKMRAAAKTLLMPGVAVGR